MKQTREELEARVKELEEEVRELRGTKTLALSSGGSLTYEEGALSISTDDDRDEWFIAVKDIPDIVGFLDEVQEAIDNE